MQAQHILPTYFKFLAVTQPIVVIELTRPAAVLWPKI
jgi:hypothetical protein